MRAWNPTAPLAYNGFGLDLDGAWGRFDRHGRVKATLREGSVPGAPTPTVAWVTGASVAEALEALGGADRTVQ